MQVDQWSRRRFLRLAGLMAAAGVVAACQPAAPTPTPAPKAEAPAPPTPTATVAPAAPSSPTPAAQVTSKATGGVRLVWWSNYAEGSSELTALKAVAEAYARSTGHRIDLVTVPWDELRKKLATASQAGEGPEVMGPVPHDWFGALAKQELAAPLPADALEARDQYLRASLDAVTYGGKLYGFPLFIESVALIRNRRLVPQAPRTWDELLSVAKELTKGDQYGFLMPILDQYHTYGFVTGHGGYIFKWENGAYNITDIGLASDGAVKGFEFIRDLNLKHRLFPEALLERKNMFAVTTGKFEEGKAGMMIGGPWTIPGARKARIDYGISVLPKLPNGADMQPFSGVQALMVGNHAKNRDQAFGLARFATTPDSVVTLWKAFAKVPVRQDVLARPDLKSDPEIQVWSEQAALALPMPNIPEMGAVWKPWGDALDVIVPGKAEVKPTLERAVQQIREGIAKLQR